MARNATPVTIVNGGGAAGTADNPLVVSGASGGNAPLSVKAAPYDPEGYQQIADATLASATALTVPTGSTVAIVQNNGTQAARWRDDGTNPTTTTGQRLAAGGVLTYDGNLAAIKFIREAAGVTLDVAYYS